jgi:hypothetical protein
LGVTSQIPGMTEQREQGSEDLEEGLEIAPLAATRNN